MTWKESDLPALRELESTILRICSAHQEMNDYNAGRAYEAAYQHYRARLRGREPRPTLLKALDLETFGAVRDVCEGLLTQGALPMKSNSTVEPRPVELEKLVEYLRELHRSVERHTRAGGRRGYLEFIRTFIP